MVWSTTLTLFIPETLEPVRELTDVTVASFEYEDKPFAVEDDERLVEVELLLLLVVLADAREVDVLERDVLVEAELVVDAFLREEAVLVPLLLVLRDWLAELALVPALRLVLGCELAVLELRLELVLPEAVVADLLPVVGLLVLRDWLVWVAAEFLEEPEVELRLVFCA